MMNIVSSKDGTKIAYDRLGSGPAVILVEGALGYRSFGMTPHLGALLVAHFTVYTYDRRGRGESGNSLPFALEREVEDIEALIQEAGGEACLFGISSGACLVLEAALRLGGKCKKLALYEPPYDSTAFSQPAWREYRKKLSELLAADKRGAAVALFMQYVGVPAEQIEGMRQSPEWPKLEAVAPTLDYDAAAIGKERALPVERLAQLAAPVLALDGGANLEIMPFMHATAQSLAQALPHAQQRTLEGQRHDVNPEVLAPVLVEFFSQ